MAVVDDQDIRDRAGKDLAQSFLVDAGAGTGKTTVLVSRILGAIASGKSSLNRIVAITFTEKAAGELKLRLRSELEKALRELNGENLGHVRQALIDIERAQVSTIHSFCATLLRERPIEAGVEPGFEVLDEIGANLFRDQTWEEWLAREMDQASGILAEALGLGIRVEDFYRLGRFLLHHRDVLRIPSPVAEDREAFLRCVAQDLPRLEELQKSCQDRTDRGWVQIESLKESARALARDNSLTHLIVRPLALRPNDGNQKNWSSKEALAEVKQRVAEIKESYGRLVSAVRHNLAVALLRHLTGYVAHYETAKQERGRLDFLDLLHRTRELLKTNLEVRGYFQGRFDYLFVDEFQDTDPLQVEIVFFLAERSPRAQSWTEVQLKPGKLFLVGDPKQSIYRFRRADIETYHAAERIVARQGKVLDLSLNFRSRPQVVEWVNGLFSGLIQPSEDGFYQPAYRPIIASVPKRGDASVLLLPLAPQVPIGEASAGELRTAEARTVAAFLHRVVAEEWPVWDRRDGKKRKIAYGDVGILFRAKEAMDLYEEEFRDFEIPYRVAGGRRYYSRQEMGALLAVLSAIDNPKDKVAVTAALRSPFFSVSDEELFLFVSSGLDLDYLGIAPEVPGAAKSIQDAFRLLRELNALRNQMPVPLFILKLYEDSRILPFFYLKPQGDQKVANLLKVAEMARSLAEQGLVTLRSFVRFLTKMEAAEAEEGESPLAEESENVARLMTIHKAKGLEFPLVILADVAYQSRLRLGEGIVNRQEGHLEIRLGNSNVNLATQGWEEAGEIERLREEAEDSRLLYVAATRARDYLAAPFFPGEKKRFLGPLWENLGIGAEVPWGKKLHPYGKAGPVVWVYDSRKLDVEKKELKPFRIGVEAKKKKAKSRSLQQFRSWEQALQQTHESGKTSERILAAAAVVEEAEKPDFQRGWAQGRGPIFGSFVHELFYHIDLRRPEGLETMAAALAKKYALEEAGADRAVELVRWGLSSNVLKRAARSDRVWRELPFVCREQGLLIEGYVDLAFEEDGEIVVVDFKTDEVKSDKDMEEKSRHYTPQGLVYARSLARITQKNIREVVLLFLSAKVEKSIPAHLYLTIGQ
jgi:ATP-dependent exoDNAse (exonuclease V) beta subunit